MEKTYNGWSNYETWNAKLWLDNDQGTADEMNRMARHAEAGKLAQEIKAFVLECSPDLGASMFADLLNAALSEVDWYEIAEAYIQDNEND
jgi:hypothetical protein